MIRDLCQNWLQFTHFNMNAFKTYTWLTNNHLPLSYVINVFLIIIFNTLLKTYSVTCVHMTSDGIDNGVLVLRSPLLSCYAFCNRYEISVSQMTIDMSCFFVVTIQNSFSPSWLITSLPFRNSRVHIRFLNGFLLLILWLSVSCSVNHCVSIYLIMIIVLSVLLRFTSSSCPFGIFKPFGSLTKA